VDPGDGVVQAGLLDMAAVAPVVQGRPEAIVGDTARIARSMRPRRRRCSRGPSGGSGTNAIPVLNLRVPARATLSGALRDLVASATRCPSDDEGRSELAVASRAGCGCSTPQAVKSARLLL
jgi:hypothetical protein